jgi:hypothetical protein
VSLRVQGGAVINVQVAVCGPAECTEEERRWARRIGELLALRGTTVICGGGPGVMAAVTEGARSAGGVVIGVLPGGISDRASVELTAAISTKMGQARNAIIISSADAVIAVGGSWGTLSEIALAMRSGVRPVVVLGGWQLRDAHGATPPGLTTVASAEEAVDAALAG